MDKKNNDNMRKTLNNKHVSLGLTKIFNDIFSLEKKGTEQKEQHKKQHHDLLLNYTHDIFHSTE